MPYLNRCIWTPASSGTGSFVVSAAAQNGYVPANCEDPLVIDGATYHYFAVSGTQHEEGDGVWSTSTSTLTRATIRNGSSGAGTTVNFTSAPTVFMGSPTANDMLTLATANQTWYVNPSTGSDTNSGSSSAPFATIQHAANVAASYNWNGIYFPTINLANGSYSEQITLPALINCSNGGVIVGNNTTPTSVTIADTGTAYTFTVAALSQWSLGGIDLTGSYGGIDIGGELSISGPINIGSNLPNGGIVVEANASLFGIGVAFTVTASSMGGPLFSFRGPFIVDGASITFSNAVTFSSEWLFGDSNFGFLGFVGGTITNAANVTCSGQCLSLSNGAFLETDSTTKVDGSVMTRSNFPGHAAGFYIDYTSTFMPDGGAYFGQVGAGYVGLTVVTEQDPNGSDVAWDYTNSFSGNTVARFQMFPWGGAQWQLNSGTSEVGLIAYSTPNGVPGIVMKDASGNSRSDIRLISGGGFQFGGNAGSGSPTMAWEVTAAGSLLGLGSNPLGYTTGNGAGGTVTQATSKSTGVTLNKVTGQITMNAAALASATTVSFTLTNSAIAAGDVLILNHHSGGTAGSYALNAQTAAGSASINVRNISSGSLSEAIIISFVVIKASTN